MRDKMLAVIADYRRPTSATMDNLWSVLPVFARLYGPQAGGMHGMVLAHLDRAIRELEMMTDADVGDPAPFDIEVSR